MARLRTLNDRFDPRPVTDLVAWERYAAWPRRHLAKRMPGVGQLAGDHGAGPAALLAAVSPQVQAVDVDLEGFADGDEACWARLFATPSLRQIGGLHTVRAALAGRRLTLRGAQVVTP